MPRTILYIGGFELPDKNAAAQRVIGIAKGLRVLGNEVVFLNSLKKSNLSGIEEKDYYGFKCIEYKRESEKDYLFQAKTALSMIKRIAPNAVIAYNYPAIALNRIRKFCQRNSIKCYADATEWYQAVGENLFYRTIKNFDTAYRMRVVQKKLDGVIAISRFLYDYYKDSVKTVLVPPTVDITDEKWNVDVPKEEGITSFVYAGVPIALKEKLDTIVSAIIEVAKSHKVVLNVVGVTEQQFIEMYNWTKAIPVVVKFRGKVEHTQVIEIVKKSDWAIILRDNNRVVKAGFPTKLVEAISCGTPVVINEFSNVCDYIDVKNGITIKNFDQIEYAIQDACNQRKHVNTMCFDYHNFLNELNSFIS